MICALTGRKLAWMKFATPSSAYDSASSRAHAPQAGPALKSKRIGRPALRAFVAKALELLEAGIHLLLIDLFPPGPRDPQGIHSAVWSEILDDGFQLPSDKPLTLVSYSAGPVKNAYIEPVAVGDVLPEMPLFLEPERYIAVPLEATYRAAFEAVPRRWQAVLEPRAPG